VKKSFINFNEIYSQIATGEVTFSAEQQRYFETIFQVCIPNFIDMINKTYLADKHPIDYKEIVPTISELQYTINETTMVCMHNNRMSSPCEVTRVLTSNGFCFSYNLESHETIFRENLLSKDFDDFKHDRLSEWSPLTGYVHESSSVFPVRISSGSRNKAAFILIHDKFDEVTQCSNRLTTCGNTTIIIILQDHGCVGPDQGFRIYWHMPNEIPGDWHHSTLLGPLRARELIMKATKVSTSAELKRYDPAQRRCYFENERYLQYFKSYTKAHCDLECLANYTLARCGCVKFFMPRNESTPVCDFFQLKCALDAESSWLENDESYRQDSMPCGCFPSCALVKYDVILDSESDFDANGTLKSFGEFENHYRENPGGQLSRFSIVFEDFLIEDHENYLGYKMQHFIR
jgi:acid-sensing ion channel, other